MDSAPLLYSSWENLSLFRHLSNSSDPTRAGVRDGESASTRRSISCLTSIESGIKQSEQSEDKHLWVTGNESPSKYEWPKTKWP